MRPKLAAIALLMTSVAGSAAQQTASSAVDIAPFVAVEVDPKVHLLTTPDDWYAAAIPQAAL